MWALALAWKAYCRPQKLHRQGAKAALDSMLTALWGRFIYHAVEKPRLRRDLNMLRLSNRRAPCTTI